MPGPPAPASSTEAEVRAAEPEAAGHADATRPHWSARARELAGRHPGAVVALCCFLVLTGTLWFKNRHLFDIPIYEDGDAAANAVIIADAKRFELLVGNYSRQEFSHPGPATFYVEALGEVVIRDVAGLVPTRHNAHLLALMALNAALLSVALAILWSATRSRLVVVAGLATVVAFAATHHPVLVNHWMPFVYFSPFVLLMVASASVAVGNSRHLWCLAVAGGLLVHGHVAFALFAPVTAVAALASMWLVRRRGAAPVLPRRDLVAAAGVTAVFLLPLVLNLALNWPGEFGDYFDYSSSERAGGHSLSEAWSYVLSFWAQDAENRLLLVGVLVVTAATLAAIHPRPQARRLLVACLASVALQTALMVFYAVRGIDDLGQRYIGFFYWAAPLVVLVVLVTGLVGLVSGGRRQSAVVLLGSLAVLVAAGRGGLLVDDYRGNPRVPAVVAQLGSRAPAGVLALDIDRQSGAWAGAFSVLVEAERQGLDACIVEPFWEFMATADEICDDVALDRGLAVWFTDPGTARGALATLNYADVVVERREP